ncbi:TPA: hypothetical protein ACH3X1_014774 [Trebouxia sp. C0004]
MMTCFMWLKQVCSLLGPFTLVIAAVQAARTTLAVSCVFGCSWRIWLFLAKQMSSLVDGALPPAFKAHCFMPYNIRHEEMVSEPCKLALFLHPLYREAVSVRKANWIEVQKTAGNLWNDRYQCPNCAVLCCAVLC